MRLPLKQVRLDGGTQLRAKLVPALIEEYRPHYREAVVLPPPVVFCDEAGDHWLADGFHRCHAATQELGPEGEIDCDVRAGSQRDAQLYAASANEGHGLRRSPADRRRAAALLLRDEEWRKWSDREIARRILVDPHLVGEVRAQLIATGEIPQLEVRKGRDGKERVLPKPKKQLVRSEAPLGYDAIEVSGDELHQGPDAPASAEGRVAGELAPVPRDTGAPGRSHVPAASDGRAEPDGLVCGGAGPCGRRTDEDQAPQALPRPERQQPPAQGGAAPQGEVAQVNPDLAEATQMLGELRGQLLLTERKRDEWAEVSRQLQLQVTELQEQRVQLNLEVTRQQVGGQLKEQRIAELEAELGRSPATSPKVVRDAEQDGYRRGREEGEAVRSGALNQAAGRGYKQGQDELLLVIAGWLDLPVGGAPEELRSEVEQAISLLKGGSCGRCEMREAELQLLLGLPPTAPWQNLVNRIRAHLLAAKEVAQPAKPTTACPARTDEPITPAEIDLALGRALKVDSDWWGPLRKTGADDAKLREHIARLFGISVSNFGPDQVGTLAKGERVPKAPIIYFSRSERINEKTSLSLHGPALIAAARRLLQIPEHAPPASSQACTEAELLESCLQYNRFAKLLRGVSDEDLLAALRARILDGSGGPGGSGQIGQYGPRGAIRCKLGRKPKQEPVVRFAASSAVFDYDGREVQGAELAAMLRAVFLPTSTAPPCTGCGQPLAPNRMCPQRPLSVCSATDPLTEAARKLGTKHGRERLRPWASKGEELRKLTTTLGAESKTAEEQAELHAVYKAAFDKSNRR